MFFFYERKEILKRFINFSNIFTVLGFNIWETHVIFLFQNIIQNVQKFTVFIDVFKANKQTTF